MKLVVLFFVSLFFLCDCSKRTPSELASEDQPELKRIKTVLTALSEAVLRGDTEGFTQILGNDEDTLYLEAEQISGLLQTAVDNGFGKLLQRMLTFGSFKDQLNYDHINFALCCCLPDVLREILTVWPLKGELTEEDEEEIAKLQNTSLSTCPAKINLLASVFQPFWQNVEGACKRHPSTLEYLLKQHFTDDLEHVSSIDFELMWLAGLHMASSCMSTFFYEWIWIDNPDRAHDLRPTIFLVMESILKAIDEGTPEDLKNILLNLDEDETDIIQVVVMTIESIVRRMRYDLLDVIPTNTHTASFLSYKRFYNVFSHALRDGKVDNVNSLLVKLSPSLCVASMQHSLLDIFDDWILDGDLHSINLSSTYLFPFLTKEQNGFLRLVQHVFSGDWRYLLVFMQMHPNRIIISDAAWYIMLCERPSDNFINMILNSQVT